MFAHEIEPALRAEIASLLHVSEAELGRDAELFELGFDSVLVVQLLIRLRHRFGIDLGIRDLFVTPTIEALSNLFAERIGI